MTPKTPPQLITLYSIYIFELYDDLRKTGIHPSEITLKQLWKIAEYYVCVIL